MTIQEQNSRIAEEYQKMTPKGRDVLDRIVQKLTEAHEIMMKPGARSLMDMDEESPISST
jgi:FixJ family two-component response regulator